MTIKQIGLSALTASLIATTAIAADLGSLTLVGGSDTYNTVYTANLTGTVEGTSTKPLIYSSKANLLNKNMVYFTLETGADFNGTASDWSLENNVSVAVGEGIAIQTVDGKRQLAVRMNDQGLAKDTNSSLLYNGILPTFKLDSLATTDIGMQVTARDNENNIDLDDARANAQIFTKQTYSMTGKIDCGAKVVIDSDGKKSFVENIPATTTTHTAQCTYDMADITQKSDIDFDYTDVNVTTTVSAGYFLDGNFTTTSTGATSGDNPPVEANAQTWTHAIDANDSTATASADYNQTITYKLDGNNDNILRSTEFPFVSSISFNKNDGIGYEIVTAADKVEMVWELSTYLCEVLGMKTNVANSVETNIKLYNSDSSDAVVEATVTLEDGSDTYTLENLATVPAEGAKRISGAMIVDAAVAAGHAVPKNGYKVVLGYADTDKTNGNAVATQRNADGTYPIRINDNGTNARGTSAAGQVGYMGL